MRMIGVIVLLLGVGAAAQPQRFEVASVRESQGQGLGSYRLSPAVRFTSIPLDSIIMIAFAENMQEALTHQFRFDFSKVNAGLLAMRFDIDGRGDGDPAAMLRTLLGERFGLRTHVETREGLRYAVTVKEAGELGPRNVAPQANSGAACACGVSPARLMS